MAYLITVLSHFMLGGKKRRERKEKEIKDRLVLPTENTFVNSAIVLCNTISLKTETICALCSWALVPPQSRGERRQAGGSTGPWRSAGLPAGPRWCPHTAAEGTLVGRPFLPQEESSPPCNQPESAREGPSLAGSGHASTSPAAIVARIGNETHPSSPLPKMTLGI